MCVRALVVCVGGVCGGVVGCGYGSVCGVWVGGWGWGVCVGGCVGVWGVCEGRGGVVVVVGSKIMSIAKKGQRHKVNQTNAKKNQTKPNSEPHQAKKEHTQGGNQLKPTGNHTKPNMEPSQANKGTKPRQNQNATHLLRGRAMRDVLVWVCVCCFLIGGPCFCYAVVVDEAYRNQLMAVLCSVVLGAMLEMLLLRFPTGIKNNSAQTETKALAHQSP